MKLELHIEELVLRGIGAAGKHEIRAAMERELAELLGGEGVAASMGRRSDLSRMDGGLIKLSSEAKAPAVGGQLAHAVLRGIVG